MIAIISFFIILVYSLLVPVIYRRERINTDPNGLHSRFNTIQSNYFELGFQRSFVRTMSRGRNLTSLPAGTTGGGNY
jgi:hypothetical protein